MRNGLVLVVVSLTTEKLLIKPNPSEEDAQKLVVADSVYGIAGVLVLYTAGRGPNVPPRVARSFALNN